MINGNSRILKWRLAVPYIFGHIFVGKFLEMAIEMSFAASGLDRCEVLGA